jgi:hypothetical protein
MGKRKRQAVILIHGIGEQRPMDTLRAFVDTVWTKDPSIHHEKAGHQVWSKPDGVADSYELRRISTPQNKEGVLTDFFELYWAHLLEDTSYGHVWSWGKTLLLRPPSKVPPALRSAWWLVVGMLVASAFFGLTTYDGWDERPMWQSLFLSVVLAPLAGVIVVKIVGDAARYLHVAPSNIQARHAIREAGVKVLTALHDPERDYDRIIVVGHSLGSVIGYDILSHTFARMHGEHHHGAKKIAALEVLEALARDPKAKTDEVQAAQHAYWHEMRENGARWLVTDFVTLGSPLTHASLLLARDRAELAEKQEARELPTCLPRLERSQRAKKEVLRFSYEPGAKKAGAFRIPDHAAVFAPTRWTNLYFPSTLVVVGDIVGGPLRGEMGAHVRDVAVSTTLRSGVLSHTLYWTGPGDGTDRDHVVALREAIRLADPMAPAVHLPSSAGTEASEPASSAESEPSGSEPSETPAPAAASAAEATLATPPPSERVPAHGNGAGDASAPVEETREESAASGPSAGT